MPLRRVLQHIVAVLLSLRGKSGNIVRIDTKTVKNSLLSKTTGELADIILKHASYDTEFMKFLFTKAQLDMNKSVDSSFIRSEIDRHLNEAYHTGYADVYGYVKKLEQFAEGLKEMLNESPEKAAEIFLYFIRQSINTFEGSGIDDSNGDFGDFIISLGKPYSAALEASGGGNAALSKDLADLYFRAADYGLDDCFDPVLKTLSREALHAMERLALEMYERVKDKGEPWQFSTERFFLVYILALLGKKGEYVKLCKEWGEEEWIDELDEECEAAKKFKPQNKKQGRKK